VDNCCVQGQRLLVLRIALTLDGVVGHDQVFLGFIRLAVVNVFLINILFQEVARPCHIVCFSMASKVYMVQTKLSEVM
jgi:hypothetical protein